ncbi:hypothetical protein B0H14DRAFT_1059377 [Mycena olivaceomarginata]|nr:hypothetical protein B0H14DRAFT_1059377 [Mycena olivaceomarginata]
MRYQTSHFKISGAVQAPQSTNQVAQHPNFSIKTWHAGVVKPDQKIQSISMAPAMVKTSSSMQLHSFPVLPRRLRAVAKFRNTRNPIKVDLKSTNNSPTMFNTFSPITAPLYRTLVPSFCLSSPSRILFKSATFVSEGLFLGSYRIFATARGLQGIHSTPHRGFRCSPRPCTKCYELWLANVPVS